MTDEYGVDLGYLPSFFQKIGMGNGIKGPMLRFVFGMVICGIPIYLIKPKLFFNSNGSPKNWALLSDSEGSTYFPWWSVGFSLGAIFSLFM